MRHILIRLVPAGLIALCMSWALMSAEPADSRQHAQAAILELAEHLNDRDVADRARKIVKEHDSCDISTIFQLKRRGGLGVGKLATSEMRDSVQLLIMQLANKKTNTEQHLEENQADYLRVAKVMQAMAQLAPFRGKEFTRGNEKKEKEWADLSLDFQQKTAEFRAAIEDRDPKKVRLAAFALNNTCCHCHQLRD